MSQDAPRRTRLADARQVRMDRPEVAAAYEQTRLRYELAETVRLRREELGWSQRQLAERAGMSQPGVARFEAGGTTPTLPLLERLAQALGLTLNVSLQRPSADSARQLSTVRQRLRPADIGRTVEDRRHESAAESAGKRPGHGQHH